MSDVERVLAVVGAKELAELCRFALSHPRLAVEVASAEREIVAALESGAYRLAIAGPGVGRRPPLVVADALRLRAPGLRLVVLLGPETDEQELGEHQRRELGGVTYLDLSGLISERARGESIRAALLTLAGIDEDAASAQSWAEQWRAAASASPPPPVKAPSSEALTVVEPAPLPAVDEPPPVPQPLTDDDLEFAKRVVQQTRAVNFRGPPKSLPADDLDHTAQRLREQVRLLERQLARLAFVYQARGRVFEAAEQRLAEAEERRETISRHWQSAREREATKEMAWQKERAEHHGQLQAFAERLSGLEGVVADLAGQTGGLWAASRESSKALADGLNRVLDAMNSLHRTLEEPWKVGRPQAVVSPVVPEPASEAETPILLTEVVEPRPATKPATVGPWRTLQWVFGALLLLPVALFFLCQRSPSPPPPEVAAPTVAAAEASGPVVESPALDPEAAARMRRDQVARAAAAEQWGEVVTLAEAAPAGELDADETWHLAEAYRRLRRPALAERTYWQFIERFADDRRTSQAWLWVADLLARQERVTEAADIYEMLATEGEDAVRRKAVLLLARLRAAAPGDPDAATE